MAGGKDGRAETEPWSGRSGVRLVGVPDGKGDREWRILSGGSNACQHPEAGEGEGPQQSSSPLTEQDQGTASSLRASGGQERAVVQGRLGGQRPQAGVRGWASGKT